MTILEILNEINSKRSGTFKSSVLIKHKDNELLQKVFKMAYSPEFLYGIKKVDQSKASGREWPSALDLNLALVFIENELCTRNKTGHEAHSYAADLILNLQNPEDAEIIHRILNNDLECGASVSLANKVWPKLIKIQPQNLATANSEKAMNRITFPAILQLKEDGGRLFGESVGSDVVMITRGSNLSTGLTNIETELKEVFSGMLGDWVVDGEIVAFKDGVRQSRQFGNGLYNKSIQGTITPEESDLLKFIVWDFFPKFVYESKELAKDISSYKERFDILAELIKDKKSLVLIESCEVNSLEEANAKFLGYLTQGLEGSIIKNYDCKWVDGRNPDIVKMKLCEPIDMEIIDVYPHKKDPNKLGGITVRTNCGTCITNCGSGFSDTDYILSKYDSVEMKEYIPLSERAENDRELLWSIRDTLIGKIVELECGGPVTSKGRDTYSLFLPIFKEFRHDKNIANNLNEVFDLSLFGSL